jgi:hypothetical protein
VTVEEFVVWGFAVVFIGLFFAMLVCVFALLVLTIWEGVREIRDGRG